MKAIVVFGDSITFGRGDEVLNKESEYNSVGRGWVGRLKTYFESKDYYNVIYNMGIPGDTTDDLLYRMEIECKSRLKLIREEDKYVILLAIGTNDARYLGSLEVVQQTTEKYEDNLRKLLAIAKKYAGTVLLLNLTPVNEQITTPYEGTYFLNKRIEEFNGIIDSVGRDEGIKVIDVYSDLVNYPLEKILGDGLHPNSTGYEIMFKKILEKLEEFKVI